MRSPRVPAPPPALGPALDATPPASGAAVMGTGIVSIALVLDQQRALSDILLVIDSLLWLGLAVLALARARRDWAQFRLDGRHPAALTSIAGTCVLGTRLTLACWSWAGAAMLSVALALWLWLVPHVLRYWQPPAIGASFMLTVATEAIALLAATLARLTHTGWLVYAALVPLGLGLGLYLFVLVHFDWRQLGTGTCDHWVTGGALAISTVTAGSVALAVRHTGTLPGGEHALKSLSLWLWGLTLCWLPALLLSEACYPRLAYNVRRWSTVFPVGMYATCSFVVGTVTGTSGITGFAQVWVWVSLAVWMAVFAGMLRRARGLVVPCP